MNAHKRAAPASFRIEKVARASFLFVQSRQSPIQLAPGDKKRWHAYSD
jgi:hypothetical protein